MPEDSQHDKPNELTAKVSLAPIMDPSTRTPILLPGIVAIGLYMLVLSAVITFGVVGNHYPKLFLILAALFVTASFGILRMFRWAWALTLAAVFLLACYHSWFFFAMKQSPSAIQGVLNLVFFLYLVRVEVRSRLR